jgi:putative endonuclease
LGISVGSVDAKPRQTLGRLGEALAGEHLERRGFCILERNYRTRWGELDIVAFDGTTLAFCEVKTRRVNGYAGTALEAVNAAKRAQVRKIARGWLTERDQRQFAKVIRFDAIGVTVDRRGKLLALEHLEGAF